MRDVVIREESSDGLRAEEWRFWFYESRGVIVLDGYKEEERPSRRHKFRPVAGRRYDRLGGSRNYPSPIREEDVPLSSTLCSRVIETFVESLRVVRWSEVGR
jgi:hypothetical protein